MTFFSRHWSTYRQVLEHDLMEHGALTAALTGTIDGWLEQRGPGAPAPHALDLGCGDLSLLPPLLRRLPLASFTGIDLNGAVLPLAGEALGPVPYPCRFLEGDLLAWAEAEPEGPPMDLLLSSFAVHHLQEPDKGRFLRGCRRRIAPGACCSGPMCSAPRGRAVTPTWTATAPGCTAGAPWSRNGRRR